MGSKRNYLVCMTLLVAVLGLGGCTPPDTPGYLVPPTADQDPLLDSFSIEVDGNERQIHYRTFGATDNPPLFIMHGSISDMRAYLPCEEFSDRYRVVMWDQRGNGLSERVTAGELDYEDMVAEIKAVKNHFSPDTPITLMGHSWSAAFAVLYLGTYPEDVTQAVLIEPFGLKSEYQENVEGVLNLTSAGYLNMSFSADTVGIRTHELLDYRCLEMLTSGVRDFYCDPENQPEWPVWRPGGYALIVWERNLLDGTHYRYDFTRNVGRYTGDVLLVGTECSPIGYEFQEQYNRQVFEDTQVQVLQIENSGHRLFTEQFDALVEGMQEFLDLY